MPVCDMPVVHTVCSGASDAAEAAVEAPFNWFAQRMADVAATMFKGVWQVIDTTTYVDITSGAYTRVYNVMFGIAIFVMLGFFMLQVIGGMIRREPAALSRSVLGLAKAILGSFVALTLLATALEITDQLCVGIVNASGTSMDEMSERVGQLAAGLGAISLATAGAGSILTIFLSTLAMAAAMIVWISLLVRKALLLIAIVFAPIALAGSSWDHTRSWLSRWATFVIAMIVSKLVLVVIFVIATAQVSAPIDGDLRSVSQPMAGVVLMLLAGFAPYLTYKAVAFMGFDMYHAMSAEQEAKSALNRPLPIPIARRGGRAEPAKVLDGRNGGGGERTAPAATPPTGGGTPSGESAAGGAGGSAGAGSAGTAGSAAAGLGVAAVAAKKAAGAGPKVGAQVAASGEGHTDGASSHAPSPAPPHAADQTLADSSSRAGSS